MRLLLTSLLFALAAPASAQTLADTLGGCLGNPPLRTIPADPSNYRTLLAGLQPGDRLLLAAGVYGQGLPFQGQNGTPGSCITVEGAESGPRAVFTARPCCNTISIRDSSYLALRHLEVDGSASPDVDGVKAEGDASFAHHITLDDLYVHDHDADQQIVGISTKCPAWNWVIRRTIVRGAGTGLYLGNSDGSAEFVNGLVEHNLVYDTIGYNMQIKHQNGRPSTALGAPASATTLVRHNVFSKASGGGTGANARPNLLLGHWPLTGPGSSDVYQVYGNVFHQNPTEALFQGTGQLAFYANLLLNDAGDAANFQAHEGGSTRNVEVFHNTIVASGVGLRVIGLDPGAYLRRVRANAAFAATPFSLAAGVAAADNVSDARASAATYLGNPDAPLGAGLSFFPRAGQLSGAPADLSGLSAFLDWDRDFNYLPFAAAFRGAYSGQGANPGWTPALERK
ncbi:MAG TPA: right-handed parallel beta-helix repeat-containing protein, partial [Vicinamibacteria bacterium]